MMISLLAFLSSWREEMGSNISFFPTDVKYKDDVSGHLKLGGGGQVVMLSAVTARRCHLFCENLHPPPTIDTPS
jgi:hypothetical protein